MSTLHHDLLTVKEVSKRLNLCRSKVYGLIRWNGLPVVHFGRATRVDPIELDAWVEKRKKEGRS